MLARVCALLLGLWLGCTSALADPLPGAQRDLFMSFARDVSGNDPEVMAVSKTFVNVPPTTLEEIGFYGLEAVPAPERSLRGIISALEGAGYIRGAEDKYIYEFPLVLMDEGLIDPAGSQAALDVLSYFDRDRGAQPDWPRFKRFFVKHTQAMEQAVANKGNRLLSVQLPLGDTLYFWLATPDQADRWRNTALYSGVNTLNSGQAPLITISITDPDWKSYWSFVTYALQIPQEHWGVPDGL